MRTSSTIFLTYNQSINLPTRGISLQSHRGAWQTTPSRARRNHGDPYQFRGYGLEVGWPECRYGALIFETYLMEGMDFLWYRVARRWYICIQTWEENKFLRSRFEIISRAIARALSIVYFWIISYQFSWGYSMVTLCLFLHLPSRWVSLHTAWAGLISLTAGA